VPRNANQANATIFANLSSYSADRGYSIPTGFRRVFLEEEDYDGLVDTKRLAHLRLGRRQAAALLGVGVGEVLVVSGFDSETLADSLNMRETELTPGVAVAALADLEIEPSAAAASVYNVVAAGSSMDSDYEGHDLGDVLALFPRIRVLELDPPVAGLSNFEPNLLVACAAESAQGNGWIDESLAAELVRLAEQRITAFPYEFLVRATLDLDPRSLFLALYRCLEATYAYKRSSELSSKLGVRDLSWFEVARIVGESLSWYPRHHESLTEIFRLPVVDALDLDALAGALGKEADSQDPAATAAAAVREWRNALVHYGPTSRRSPESKPDWNAICKPLAKVVGDVFSHAYADVADEDGADQPSHALSAGQLPGFGRRLVDAVLGALRRTARMS
jgi:hypothetical protein